MENRTDNSKRTDRHRLQFDVTTEMCALLDQLADETGLATRASVMRRAISIYRYLWEAEKKGNRVAIVDKEDDVRGYFSIV